MQTEQPKRKRVLTLWAPPPAFEVRGGHADRAPTAEEKARNDEQVRRLEAALRKRE